MASSRQRGWRPVCRRALRWCRVLFLLIIFLAVGGAVYVTQIGLPEFLKRPLVEELRGRGIEADFSRITWQWQRGIVIENLALRQVARIDGPRVLAADSSLDLDLGALIRGRVNLRSVVVSGAELIYPGTGAEGRPLALRSIRADLRFPGADSVEVRRFEAVFREARLNVQGGLTNASSIRGWDFMRRGDPAERDLRAQLRRLEEALDQFEFSGPPELWVKAYGDAEDFGHLEVDLNLAVPGARTPWGEVGELHLGMRLPKLSGSGPGGVSELALTARDASAKWGAAKTFQAVITLSQSAEEGAAISCDGIFSFEELKTTWAAAEHLELAASTTHLLSNGIPRSGTGAIRFRELESQWGRVASGTAEVNLEPSDRPLQAKGHWAGWAAIEPYLLKLEADLSGVVTPRIAMEKARFAASWVAPEVVVERFESELLDANLSGAGRLDVETRAVQARFNSDFDPHRIAHLLTENGRRWLAQYSWEQPPVIEGRLRMTAPGWRAADWDWFGKVLPGFEMEGRFSVGSGAFREVSADGARSDFRYADFMWHLPNLHVTRPEGAVEIDFSGNNHTRAYRFRLLSGIDVMALMPWLEEEQRRALGYFEFTAPPRIHAEVSGLWEDHDSIAFTADVTARQFSFRGVPVDSFDSALRFEKRVLGLANARVTRGTEELDVPEATVDFTLNRVTVAGARSTMDPGVVTGVIGKVVAEAVEPYRFRVPPDVRLDGFFSMVDPGDADLRFEVNGREFEWLQFAADEVSGDLHWLGETLSLTNVQAKAYGEGDVLGWAYFDFSSGRGADFECYVKASNVTLSLAAERFDRSRAVSGFLDGELRVTGARTEDLESWDGFGRLELRETPIWEIPVFGFFSPVMNAVAPGLGSAWANEASGTFTMSRSVLYSDDFEISAPAIRIRYRGTVDFNRNVQARVEAEVLREAWLIGRVVNLALSPFSKILEYEVTGTLDKPAHRPVYVPRFLMMTLRPFHTLRSLLPDSDAGEYPPAQQPVLSQPQ